MPLPSREPFRDTGEARSSGSSTGPGPHSCDSHPHRTPLKIKGMTIMAVGSLAMALGGALPLRRTVAGWNARMSDRLTTQHIKDVTRPNDGAPRYIAAVGALIFATGLVLVTIGLSYV